MDDQESQLFITVTMAENAKPVMVPADRLLEEIAKRYSDTASGLASVRIIVGRLELTDLSYSPDVVLMLGYLSDRPGVAVAWAYTLYEETRKRGPYTIAMLAKDFPWGFPRSEAYSAYWDAQKGWAQEPKVKGVDNMLDQAETWKPPVAEPA
jgi:hypothetical protein